MEKWIGKEKKREASSNLLFRNIYNSLTRIEKERSLVFVYYKIENVLLKDLEHILYNKIMFQKKCIYKYMKYITKIS